jgi:hypothetical protein
MRPVRLLSIGFALSAAIVAIASGGRRQAPLLADEAVCNGIGKNCDHAYNCTTMCSNTCCGYSEAWTYYPEKME